MPYGTGGPTQSNGAVENVNLQLLAWLQLKLLADLLGNNHVKIWETLSRFPRSHLQEFYRWTKSYVTPAIDTLIVLRRLKAAQQLVEFVGRVEVAFELAGSKAFAKVIETSREKVERGRKDFLVGENDVPPSGVGAAGKAQRIA